MFCSACGSNLLSSSRPFCQICGARLSLPSGINAVAPGKTLLLVTGILFVIFGTTNFFMGGILLLLAGMDGSMFASLFPLLFPFYTILRACFAVIMGIVGILFRMRPEKAGVCKVFAIISFCISGLDMIIVTAILSGTLAVTIIFAWLPAMVIPILYLVGAIKNQNASKNKTGAVQGNYHASPPPMLSAPPQAPSQSPAPLPQPVTPPANQHALAQTLQPPTPQPAPQRKETVELRNYNGDVVFRIIGNRCYDTNNSWLFTNHSGCLYDATGKCRYEIHGDRVYDTNGNWVYTIHKQEHYR